MEILEKRQDQVIVLKLAGRLDGPAGAELKKNINQKLDDGQGRFVLDMADVDFIDSSGLGSLVAILRSVGAAEGELKVAALTAQARSVFEITRLHNIFDIYAQTEAAIKSYG
jgi:anti-sigma B factor antagonist